MFKTKFYNKGMLKKYTCTWQKCCYEGGGGKQTPVYWEKNSMKQDKNGIYKKERNI